MENPYKVRQLVSPVQEIEHAYGGKVFIFKVGFPYTISDIQANFIKLEDVGGSFHYHKFVPYVDYNSKEAPPLLIPEESPLYEDSTPKIFGIPALEISENVIECEPRMLRATYDATNLIASYVVKPECTISGYHKVEIVKGVLGEVSKINEEFHEFLDSVDQGVKIMALMELSDMIGAVEAYLNKHHSGTTIDDLIKMKDVTKRAFESGARNRISRAKIFTSPIDAVNES